jgi:hypothetical protein
MEEIKVFLESLEKEGLYKSKVVFQREEYILNEGIFSVNSADDLKGLTRDKEEERLKPVRDRHDRQKALKKTKERKTWKKTFNENIIELYRKFLGKNAGRKYVEAARKGIKKLEWIKKVPGIIKIRDRRFLIGAAAVASVFIITAIIIIATGNEKKPEPVQVEINRTPPESLVETPVVNEGNPGDNGGEAAITTGPPVEIKEEVRTVEEENIRELDILYKRNINIARKAVDEGAYYYAKKFLEKAREMKETDETAALGQEIASGIFKIREEEIERERQIKEKIPRISFSLLLAGYRTRYMEKLKSIKIPGLESEIEIKGRIRIILEVDYRGKIFILDALDKNLEVKPDKHRTEIMKKVYKKIASIELIPPINSMEQPVMVTDWSLTYRIGTYKTDIILTIVHEERSKEEES